MGINVKREQGLIWPVKDRDTTPAVMSTIDDMNIAIMHCRKHDVVVQAGGNCGVWPKYLANSFKTVYTFEPDCENFFCLVNNCHEHNIIKFQAALGSQSEYVNLHRVDRNVGAHYIQGSGIIPVIKLDSLRLPTCDCIILDIEGYEFKALVGATKTIHQFRPVIHLEDKGLSEKYGISKGDVENWLIDRFEYRVVCRPHRDVVLVPNESCNGPQK